MEGQGAFDFGKKSQEIQDVLEKIEAKVIWLHRLRSSLMQRAAAAFPRRLAVTGQDAHEKQLQLGIQFFRLSHQLRVGGVHDGKAGFPKKLEPANPNDPERPTQKESVLQHELTEVQLAHQQKHLDEVRSLRVECFAVRRPSWAFFQALRTQIDDLSTDFPNSAGRILGFEHQVEMIESLLLKDSAAWEAFERDYLEELIDVHDANEELEDLESEYAELRGTADPKLANWVQPFRSEAVAERLDPARIRKREVAIGRVSAACELHEWALDTKVLSMYAWMAVQQATEVGIPSAQVSIVTVIAQSTTPTTLV